MSSLEGSKIAHYEVLEQIGAGGMGVVWKARDTRLMRMVALKSLIPAKDKKSASRERLIQEARAASHLDHPNICSIYQVEELANDEIMIVMAFYHGETLAQRLKHGPLDPDSAIDITSQVLSGLQHAHERGVIHRDVKPANLILCENGAVKIVDFGLAKDLAENDGLTATGELLGTVHYMSPEQVLGKTLDHRADLWASAVVFYEMLAGAHPFSASSSYKVLEAIVQKPHRRIRDYSSQIPPYFDEVIEKALNKEISKRFQNAGEFLHALRPELAPHLYQTTQRIAFPHDLHLQLPSVPIERSIAVLPFTGDAQDDEARDFCDGLTDEIITDLSGVRSLRTICSNSAMKLKNSALPLTQIADELSVHNILQGSVRMGQPVKGVRQQHIRPIRVTAQLVEPRSSALIWADKYHGTTEDAFTIQENISREIVNTLKVTLSPEENRQLETRPLPDIRAVQFYVKAKQEILKYSQAGLDRALEYLEMGEQAVGKNVLLLTAKGLAYWQYLNAGITSDPAYMTKAKACVAEASALDPDSPHVFRLQGLIALQESRMQEAVLLLKKAIAADPNDPDSLSWYSALCALSGKAHAAMPLARRILEIDPLTPVYRFLPGLLCMSAGEFSDALPSFDDAIRLDPANALLLWLRGQTLALAGRSSEAVTQFQELEQQCEGHYFCKIGTAMTAALLGDAGTTNQQITPAFIEITEADPHYSWMLAECFSLLNDQERSLQWLQKSIDKGFVNYPMIGRWDPLLANVRRHPGFASLLQNVRRLWEEFEV